MLPEISRRCTSCGAAVRVGARFCPQCGQEFDEAGQPQKQAQSANENEMNSRGEIGGADAKSIESLAAKLSAQLDGGRDAAPKTRDTEALRNSAHSTSDVYVPAPEDERAAARESIDERGVVGAVAAPPVVDGAENAPSGVGEADALSGEGLGRVARVREGTRARVENTKARAAKMRDEALVVLEETPDDSGLRFVVFAAAVFLLFIIFLFFSTSVLR